MSAFAISQPSSLFSALQSRSMGAKFFLLLFLATMMSIPGFFISSLADDRAAQHGAATTYDSAGQAQQPHTVLGIRLADSYRSVNRSVKYITLFLGLVFLAYFLFEVTAGKRLHPGQYALVGVAQTVFYLLLLSLAEHAGFDIAFLIAGAATVTLFSLNVQWVFGSRAHGRRALVVFSLLYAFIYVLLRLEEYALLVGSMASFTAVALAMYFTRDLDWYGTGAGTDPSSEYPAPAATFRESMLD